MEEQKPFNDWWAKHNMTTRIVALVFASGVASIIIGMFLGFDINPDIADDLIWAAVAVGLGVMVGLNGIDKVTDLIKTVRK